MEVIIGLTIGLITIITALVAVVRWIVGVAGKVKDLEHGQTSTAAQIAAIERTIDHNRNSHKAEYQALVHLLETFRAEMAKLSVSVARIEAKLEG